MTIVERAVAGRHLSLGKATSFGKLGCGPLFSSLVLVDQVVEIFIPVRIIGADEPLIDLDLDQLLILRRCEQNTARTFVGRSFDEPSFGSKHLDSIKAVKGQLNNIGRKIVSVAGSNSHSVRMMPVSFDHSWSRCIDARWHRIVTSDIRLNPTKIS